MFFTNFVWTVLHHYLELGAGIWTGAKRDSEFSFSEKKMVETFSVENKFWKIDRKKNRSIFFWSTKFLVGKIFGRVFFPIDKKIDPKNIFQPTFFSIIFCFDFSSTKKNPIKKIWLPIPMGNFPKIPKIALRTACGHFLKS